MRQSSAPIQPGDVVRAIACLVTPPRPALRRATLDLHRVVGGPPAVLTEPLPPDLRVDVRSAAPRLHTRISRKGGVAYYYHVDY